MKLMSLPVMVLISGLAQANDADSHIQVTEALCEKMKSCAVQQLEAEGESVPQSMKDMIKQSMQGMCDSMISSFDIGLKQHELYQPAKACMSSMAALSCEQIMVMEDDTTSECQVYEKALESHNKKNN